MINRDKLEISVLNTIDILQGKAELSDYVEKAKSELRKYIPVTRIKPLIVGNFPLVSIPDIQLYHLSFFLKKEKLLDENLSEYFEEMEIEKYLNDIIDGYIESEIIEFTEVIKSKIREEYVCKLSYKQIAEMFRFSMVTYNINTQRVSEIVKKNNRILKRPTINQKNIDAIKQKVLEGKFESNTLTLNIRKTGSENYFYRDNTLVINKNLGETFLDVIDGWHRFTGIYLAYVENPNLIGDMTVTIKNLDIEQARQFIEQESKGTINSQEGIEFYDSENNVMKLVSDINVYGNLKNNFFFNKIITPTHQSVDAKIPYEILAKNIYSSWGEILNKSDILDLLQIKKYIIDYVNLFMSSFKTRYNKASISELISNYPVIDDPMFLSGIIIASAKTYSKNKAIDYAVAGIIEATTRMRLAKSYQEQYIYENVNNKREYSRYVKTWERIGDFKWQ